ncbi:MAG TPA: type VI secretion system membrane subunit TssM, partial [Polyangiales bacterium]|nr:type VI secretion system membrane subunit TssM [Polyangiales bacterium]
MKRKTLFIALGLLTLLFIGFVWWVYFSSASKLPLSVSFLGSLLPLAIGASVWLAQLWVARRGAHKLESALVDEGAREQRAAAPGIRSAEIDRLRQEFERAVKALKTSKLANGSRRSAEALYRLPWYAIIGPPASGKTTILRNSGLKFPYLPGTGDRLKGIGGTRNCDWWLTNHAILLDTAGRWSIEENERDEWLVFLDLLKKHRGERPLNGIIAAISLAGDDVTSISGAAEDDLKEIALRMRERLDEITGRLGVALPVYVLFTKCDLISGFVESFGNMSGEQRRQIWGFTAPVLQGVRRNPGAYFAQQFDVLREELERRAVVRMGDEVDPQIIPKVYEFPAQFGALKEKLTCFVDELFDASAFRETPLLRGAYFTSGTQEGAPADLLLEDIADALELRPQQFERREQEKKSYFLHDMLMRVVFEDRALATTSEVELVRQHWRRRAVTSALFMSAALGTLGSTNSCQHNLRGISHTEASLVNSRNARKQSEGGAAADAKPQHVPELLALEQDVSRYEQGGRGILDLGLYQGDRVSPALERYYQNALGELVIRPLLDQNQRQLLTYTQQLQVSASAKQASALDDAARNELRDALSLNLLLTTPRESCTPKPLSRKEQVVERMLALWQRVEPAEATAQRERKLLLARYLELSSQDPAGMKFGHDSRAIEQARRALGEDDRVERLLQRVIASHADPQTLATLAGSSVVLQARTSVGGAFSRAAWDRVRSDFNADDFLENDGDWVFGCGRASHDAARAELDGETFRQNYLKRYEKSWREFLDGLSARVPSNVLEAESMLNELVSPASALDALARSVGENTNLPEAKSGIEDTLDSASQKLTNVLSVAKQAANKIAPALAADAKLASPKPESDPLVEPLKDAFADFVKLDQVTPSGGQTPLEQYRQQLQPVLVALKAYRQDESKVEALATATQSALENTELMLRSLGGSWNNQLHSLLVPALNGILDLVTRGRGTQFGRAYCDAVYAPFQRELAGRFPLRPDSSDPASLAAFARFFQPGSGAIWTFQNTHLGSYVTSEGGRFRFKGAQAKTVLRDELLEFLQRSAAISQAFFSDDAN